MSLTTMSQDLVEIDDEEEVLSGAVDVTKERMTQMSQHQVSSDQEARQTYQWSLDRIRLQNKQAKKKQKKVVQKNRRAKQKQKQQQKQTRKVNTKQQNLKIILKLVTS